MNVEKIAETINGLQHIGLPTNDLEKTVAFYEGLGFSVALRTVNEAAGEQVAFLQLKELMIEAYQTGRAAGRAGAVDHIALDVADVDTLFVLLRDGGYELLDDAVRFLPFWILLPQYTPCPTGRSCSYLRYILSPVFVLR